jgi:2'-5' RNA ligase
MVQSVELTLDAAADAAVRAQWRRLEDAGLPSQARHRSPSNRPHITLAALPAIDPGCEPALGDACAAALPLRIGLGAVAVFGSDPYVLVRVVVPNRALLDLHARVAQLVGTPAGTNLSPDRWTPHVTLARRIPGRHLDTALALVGAGDLAARAVAVRRWDGDARREWTPASPPVSRRDRG